MTSTCNFSFLGTFTYFLLATEAKKEYIPNVGSELTMGLSVDS
jgi:hypothetical protein